MQITRDVVVTLSYDLTSEAGEIIESSDISGPVTFLVGKGSIIPGLDRRLEGLAKGAEATFEFPPEEAFGRKEDSPTRDIPRTEFPKDATLTKGMTFEAGVPGGGKIVLEVQSADGEVVVVRMLHPLAGQRIGMSVKVVDVRAATKAELEAGRALAKPPAPPPKKA